MPRLPLGPIGKFPFGQPIDKHDRGAGRMGFARLPDQRYMVLKFGTVLRYIHLHSNDAEKFATSIRQLTVDNFGELRYDKSTLPIKVSIEQDHRTVRMEFPQVADAVVGVPEMWLALAEVIEEKLRQLPKPN